MGSNGLSTAVLSEKEQGEWWESKELGLQETTDLWVQMGSGFTTVALAPISTTTYRERLKLGQDFGGWVLLSEWLASRSDGKRCALLGNKLGEFKWCQVGNLLSPGKRKTMRHHDSVDKWLWPRFNALRDRCNNPKNPRFPTYGGRGIAIEFADYQDFRLHCQDLPGFGKDLTLDRIDNDGNYAPGNIKFSTRVEQARNKTTNKYADDGTPYWQIVKDSKMAFQQVYSYLAQGHKPDCVKQMEPSGAGVRYCRCGGLKQVCDTRKRGKIDTESQL